MQWLLLILLSLLSAAIAYQDFKTRLISIWLVVGFVAICFTRYLVSNSYYQFLENALFCICYFLLSYLVLVLVFYFKTRKFEKLINDKIGWGDVILFISIGCCIEPIYLIYFFTTSFILSLLIQVLFFKEKKSIPMGGFIVMFYLIFQIFNLF